MSRTVRADREAAWELLTDTRRWPEWSPTVGAVEADERRIRAGTTGRVRVAGLRLPFEITSCEGYRWTWDVARVPATGHRVDAADGGGERCRVVFELPVLAAGYAPVCDRALDRIADRLEGR